MFSKRKKCKMFGTTWGKSDFRNNPEWNVSHTHTGPVSAHSSSLVQSVFSVVIPCLAVSSGPGSCPVWKGTCPNLTKGQWDSQSACRLFNLYIPTHFCYTHTSCFLRITCSDRSLVDSLITVLLKKKFIKKKTALFCCTIQITAYSLTGLVSVIWNQLS